TRSRHTGRASSQRLDPPPEAGSPWPIPGEYRPPVCRAMWAARYSRRRDEREEMPQVARIDPAHGQQYVQVGNAEVRVKCRGRAAPGAEPQIAAEQWRQLGAARPGDVLVVPGHQGPHPVLLG